LLGVVLLGICAFVFLPGLYGPFLLDDVANLTEARASTGTISEIISAIIRNDSGLLRRPIANLSFLLNYHLIGESASGYKGVNIFLHWLNACLLWKLAVVVLQQLYPAQNTDDRKAFGFFIAGLWLVHPIQVSTALYVVQRMEELSALFVCLSLLLFYHFTRAPITKPIRDVVLRSLGLWTVMSLGVLSKENAILAPGFLLCIFMTSSTDSRQFVLRNKYQRILFAVSSWIPLIVGSLVFIMAFARLTSGYAIREFSMSDRIFTEPFILFRYINTIIFPDIRNMGLYLDDVSIHHANEPFAWLVMALAVLLPAMAFIFRKRAPALSFGILWYATAHLLESTIIPLELAFEHRNYLALFGPMFSAGYYFFKVLYSMNMRIFRIAAVLPIAALGASTAVRAHQWSDYYLFTEHEAQNHPLSPRAQNSAVTLDIAAGDNDKILARVKNVQTLKPDTFWPMSLDINLACGIPGHVVRWDAMLTQIKNRPGDISIVGMLQYDTGAILFSGCPQIGLHRYDQFLSAVAQVFDAAKMAPEAEKIIVLRSYIAKKMKLPELTRQILEQAAAANPKGTVALHDLAYFELNEGNLPEATQAIDRLEIRTLAWNPTNFYDVQELRGNLNNARNQSTSSATDSLTPAKH